MFIKNWKKRPTAIQKLLEIIGRVRLYPSWSVRDRSRLGHKPDYRLGWSSESCMYACCSVSVACRPAEIAHGDAAKLGQFIGLKGLSSFHGMSKHRTRFVFQHSSSLTLNDCFEIFSQEETLDRDNRPVRKTFIIAQIWIVGRRLVRDSLEADHSIARCNLNCRKKMRFVLSQSSPELKLNLSLAQLRFNWWQKCVAN